MNPSGAWVERNTAAYWCEAGSHPIDGPAWWVMPMGMDEEFVVCDECVGAVETGGDKT